MNSKLSLWNCVYFTQIFGIAIVMTTCFGWRKDHFLTIWGLQISKIFPPGFGGPLILKFLWISLGLKTIKYNIEELIKVVSAHNEFAFCEFCEFSVVYFLNAVWNLLIFAIIQRVRHSICNKVSTSSSTNYRYSSIKQRYNKA
jgi:hypothetical protein